LASMDCSPRAFLNAVSLDHTLEVGKSADFVALNCDLFATATSEIAGVAIQATAFEGELVHES
jgi:predicted amidohydrolase YtcJ